MFKEFKEFAIRGNVADMAIGIILGAAFGKIVTSLVTDVVMPPIGLLLGGVDFAELYVNLGDGSYETLAAAQEAGAPTINYGLFMNAVLDFLIVAFVIFLVVRQMNRLNRQQPEPEPTPSEKSCAFCATTIPLAASRCPHCTSELEGLEAA